MDSLKKYSDLAWQDLPHIESPSNAAFFIKNQPAFLTGTGIHNMRKIIQETTHSLMPPRVNRFEIEQLAESIKRFDVVLLRFKPQQPVFEINPETHEVVVHDDYRINAAFGFFSSKKLKIC